MRPAVAAAERTPRPPPAAASPSSASPAVFGGAAIDAGRGGGWGGAFNPTQAVGSSMGAGGLRGAPPRYARALGARRPAALARLCRPLCEKGARERGVRCAAGGGGKPGRERAPWGEGCAVTCVPRRRTGGRHGRLGSGAFNPACARTHDCCFPLKLFVNGYPWPGYFSLQNPRGGDGPAMETWRRARAGPH